MQLSGSSSHRIVALLAILSTGFASAGTYIDPANNSFVDNYIGAAASGSDPSPINSDVIGHSYMFDIFSLTATLSGTVLSVAISTNFPGYEGVYPSLTTGSTGIGHGDLFLSSTWTPEGDAPYLADNTAITPTTLWEYGLALDDRFLKGSGDRSATLYSLNSWKTTGSNTSDIIMSDAFITTNGYRHGQGVAVNRASSGVQQVGGLGAQTWSADGALNLVNFSIDLAGTTLLDGDKIAFHWGMTCANDVIEGYVPLGSTPTSVVPIPAAGWLFGSALVGMIGFARRGRKSA